MFNPLSFVNLRLKTPVHVVQIVLALTVLILAGVRLATFPKTAPRTRGNTIALGMVWLLILSLLLNPNDH